ncbi:A/G-specific adenine glycosylase [soil metagenome]
MLQQTRVDTVVPYFQRFLELFPTVQKLAEAPLDRVLAQWSGLGYYRRARFLHQGAKTIAGAHAGVLPRTAEGLRTVPGIGPYTAGAIASIAFGEPAPIVDGNVARVLARIYAIEDDIRSARGSAALWKKAGELVRGEDPGALNQALMELGATVCTPKSPRCVSCPVADACSAFRDGRVSELPRIKEKTPAKEWRRVAIVATKGAKILLGRRREHLTFGGMWEPPSYDAAAIEPLPGDPIGVRMSGARDLGVVRHVLSHRRMEVRVYSGKLASASSAAQSTEHERFALFAGADLGSVGLSSLARKILGLHSGG